MNLTDEQQLQVERLVSNAKAMKLKDLETFIENVQQSEDIELRDAVLEGIATFQRAREDAEAVSASFTDEDVA